MSQAADLRARAEDQASPFPALLVGAEHLAATVMLGDHGRRRAGMGDEFWQYRPIHAGDEARFVDWRRSAKSDTQFIREKEWQIAQSVQLWVDNAAAMRFRSTDNLPTKGERARLLALAITILMLRGGERVGLTAFAAPPRSGEPQLMRLANLLSDNSSDADYGAPEARGMAPNSRALFVSDFMGDLTLVEAALAKAADRGVKGALLQVLDPQEEAFPFDGRTVFESMTGAVRHETLKAGDLRARYLERLAARKDRLQAIARATGWQFRTHHTGDSAQAALLWLYTAMERVH